jgi:hypothetical protein
MFQPWGGVGMPKYAPKIGRDIDIYALRHQHRIEYLTLAAGGVIIFAFFIIAALNIPIDPRKEIWLSIILAFGIAASSLGLAGAASVTFRHAGLIAQGTLGFGIFIVCLAFATILNLRC